MHQRKKEINCQSINFKTGNHAQHPSNQTKFPRHFGNFHPTYRACGFPLRTRRSNLFRSIHPRLKGLNPKEGKWIKRCAFRKNRGRIFRGDSRVDIVAIRHADLSRGARTISGTETFPAISCRASFYRRPMLFERNSVE